jgi:hypothetical protein
MKLHHLLGARIPIAATRTAIASGRALASYADVQTFAYLYRLARPNTIPLILTGRGNKLDLPSIDAVGACGNGIDLLIANDCTMVYNRLG